MFVKVIKSLGNGNAVFSEPLIIKRSSNPVTYICVWSFADKSICIYLIGKEQLKLKFLRKSC